MACWSWENKQDRDHQVGYSQPSLLHGTFISHQQHSWAVSNTLVPLTCHTLYDCHDCHTFKAPNSKTNSPRLKLLLLAS